jgi:hypothetical protein
MHQAAKTGNSWNEKEDNGQLADVVAAIYGLTTAVYALAYHEALSLEWEQSRAE